MLDIDELISLESLEYGGDFSIFEFGVVFVTVFNKVFISEQLIYYYDYIWLFPSVLSNVSLLIT